MEEVEFSIKRSKILIFERWRRWRRGGAVIKTKKKSIKIKNDTYDLYLTLIIYE